MAIIAASAGFWLSYCSSGSAAIQTFVNDFAGFQAAAGSLSVIDFETLPNGSPSMAGTAITTSFNYDAQGVHFATPIGNPVIAGNTDFGFDLFAFVQFPQRTWIDIAFPTPVRAVGIFFPARTRLFVYDEKGSLLTWTHYEQSGVSGLFLGVVSNTPIFSARVDRGSDREDIESFVWQTIPEPATVTPILIIGAVIYRRSMARRRS